MTQIDEILNKQGFTPREKQAFIEMIQKAKSLQKTTNLEDLKPFMKQLIDKVAYNED